MEDAKAALKQTSRQMAGNLKTMVDPEADAQA
jgi:hypothetical protein